MMGRKCSVIGCTSGYDSQDQNEKVSMYKFPRGEEECKQWIACLPNKVKKVTKYMGICALHWPADVPLRKRGGRFPSPAVPPSIFPSIPSSCFPADTLTCTPEAIERTLNNSEDSDRNSDVDEVKVFKEFDSFKSDTFEERFTEHFIHLGFITFHEDSCVLLSRDRTGCIHSFSLYLLKGATDKVTGCTSFSYEAYYGTERVFYPNVPNEIKFWSQLEELIRFLTEKLFCVDDSKFKY